MSALAVTIGSMIALVNNAPIPPPKNDKHGWSVANFETYRSPLTDFLKSRVIPLVDSDECNRILIRAPVKSGKREMVEYLAIRDQAHCPFRVHAFVSSFHRVADEDQRKELKIHNMHIFSLKSRKDADACIRWCDEHLRANKKVVLHIDECDFGSSDKQMMSRVYKHVRENENVTVILYSATPQEVLFSGEVKRDDNEEDVQSEDEYDEMVDDFICTGERIEYVPPDTFCGPKTFLDNGLVTEAKPFFRKQGGSLVLSEQGRSILAEARANAMANNGRNIVVLRLSYSELGGSNREKRENKAITQFARGVEDIPELAEFLIIMDKSDEPGNISSSEITREKIQWSSPKYWRAKTKSEPILIVIDQTSSRSTEWCCHDRVVAYHDYRNTVVFSTVSQAQERVNHYSTKYNGGFQRIKVYGHYKTFQLSANLINYEEYLSNEWKMKKIDRRNAEVAHLPAGESRYVIVSVLRLSVRHPNFPNALTEEEANAALQEIGCSAEVKVSPRVNGGIRTVRVYGTEFHPCEVDGWSTLKDELDCRFSKNFQNPFTKSIGQGMEGDKYKGYLRGWGVFEYSRDIEPNPGWGVSSGTRLTICYEAGVLGIAVKYDTGRKKAINTLETFNSMYRS